MNGLQTFSFPSGAIPGVVQAAKNMNVRTDTADNDALDWSAQIVAIAERSDRSAFGRLFTHFAPRLKSYMLRSGAADGDAEEIAQEAMVTVWRKAAQFDARKASASTWIFTIARNLRIDRMRRENRPEIDADDPTLVPEPEPAADHQLAVRQSEGRVRSALLDLPDDQKRVVEMSFFEDLPHAAISETLGIPLGTVKSRLRLAMHRLRDSLGDVR